MVPPVETTTDSAGGGFAQTLSAVAKIVGIAFSEREPPHKYLRPSDRV